MIKGKEKIFQLINEAESLTPSALEKDLPSMEGFPDIPSWHDYESKIWKIGEEIRQIIINNKNLRKDDSINESILKFCLNRNAKRGRESFLMLLWYKHNKKYAPRLMPLINDQYVNGHLIEGLNKMQVSGYLKEVMPFTNHDKSWIKKQAKKYVEKTAHNKS